MPPATAAALVLDLPALGGTRAAWVRTKGAPSRAALGDLFDQHTTVTFAPAPDGHERAARIDLLLGQSTGTDRAGVPVAQAREVATSGAITLIIVATVMTFVIVLIGRVYSTIARVCRSRSRRASSPT